MQTGKLSTTPLKKIAPAFMAMLFFLLTMIIGSSQLSAQSCHAKYTYKISGATVSFYDSSTAANAYKRKWTFGDGTTSDAKTPVHTYNSAGGYTICLTIFDTVNKCTDTMCQTIKVVKCKAVWTMQKGGLSVKFSDISSTGSIHKSYWSFGDGSYSNDANPGHTYSTGGRYQVCLKVTDSVSSCVTTTCDSITVTAPVTTCKAGYSVSKSGLTVTFTDISTTPNAHKRAWTFGDGGTSDAANPSHTFKPGKYRVCLKVTDSTANCTETACDSIEVIAPSTSCKAAFKITTSGLTVKVTDASTSVNKRSRTWIWGDSSTNSDGELADHTYKHAGTHKICLIIRDTTAKCTSDVCQTVTLSECNAEFTYSPNGTSVAFKADSNQSTTATFTWKFGDGTSGTGSSVTHKYAHDTVYEACLTVIDSTRSCSTKTCKAINLKKTATYSIRGKVYAGTADAYPGKVLLIVFNSTDSSLKALKYTNIKHDSTGAWYYFDGLAAGTYYTKAILDTTSSNYSGYLPTYHEKALKWKDANKIVITTSNISNAVIRMVAGTNPGGKGFVGGKISQGANKTEGDPISDIEVMILDMSDVPVAFGMSDINGNFKISNLAYGTYKVYPEVEGLETYPVIVTLSEGHQGEELIDIRINSTKAYGTTSIGHTINLGNVKVYPNPVQDLLHVSVVSQKAENATLYLYDATGKAVMMNNYKLVNGKQEIELNTQTLPSGIYMVKMQLQEGKVLQARIIKE